MSSDNHVRIVAPDFKTIYTNFVDALYGPFDISLVLNESIADGEKLVITRMARIVMSPAEAKIVAEILKNVISNYEETWGKIVPPVFQPGLMQQPEQELAEKKTEGV